MTSTGLEAPVLEAKLYPATGTTSPLPRPRLDVCLDVIDAHYPVTLVTAPAGYGKSTSMARWHAELTRRGVPCAWLTIDEADQDKARFMRHLVVALQRADPRIGSNASAHLTGDFTSGVSPLLEMLASDLAGIQRRIAVFLDDLQSIRDTEVIEIVDWLVNYAPRTVQFVIGSREDAGLRLSALRVRRQLLEIDVRRLQFDADEAREFCRRRLGFDLPAPQLQQLLAKTEGWPAALELATLAFASSDQQAQFIEQFAGTDTSVVDYLGEMVLAHLDHATRAFVFRISVFDRVCAPLAVAISGEPNADDRLSTLRARNLFLIALDRSGTWVRFHHLVGEFFRQRYLRQAGDEARACLVRGAAWLHANGLVEEAIGCAIRAADWAQATQWVAESVEELVLRRGYHQTILRWMNALPEAWVDRYPVIRIQYAFALAFYPRLQEYEAQIHRLECRLAVLEAETGTDSEETTELRCAVEFQAALSLALRDHGAQAGKLAAAWLEHWPDASLMRRGVMGNVLAFGHKTNGDIGGGLEVLARTRHWLQQADGYYSLAWTSFLEAVLLLKRGDYAEAQHICTAGLELLGQKLHGHSAHASLFHTLLAGIAYEFDEIGLAIEHMEQAMTSLDEYGPADALNVAYLTRARLQRLRHDENSASAILREGQALGERRGLRRVVVSLAAEECNGLSRARRYEEARLVATRFGFDKLPARSAPASLEADKAFRVASRYLLQESPRLVIDALGGAIEFCQQRGLSHRWVELLLLRALAHQRDGASMSAVADLRKALSIAAPRGYLRLILDEAPDLRPMLDRLDADQWRGSAAAPLLRRLQQEMRRPDQQASAAEQVSTGALEELTKREIAILKRLDSGLSNKEIAEAIFISEGTLKWHLHNVYGKLDVKNRSGAMLRARALGLL